MKGRSRKYKGKFLVRYATPRDAKPVTDLIRHMFEESHFAGRTEYTMDPGTMERILESNPSGTYAVVVAQVEDGTIVGLCSVGFDYLYTKDPWAVLDKFYVLPAYRYSKIPRKLADAAIKQVKYQDACAFFANTISGTDASRTMLNLFRKAGFQETHPGLQMIMEGGHG